MDREPSRSLHWWAPAITAAAGMAAGAAAVLALWPTPATEGPETPSTAATIPAVPEWFHPAEVLLGPTILVPERYEADPGAATLRYRLEPITPAAVGPDQAVDTAVLPHHWTLATTAGDVKAVTDPWTRAVTFALPAGVAGDEVLGLRLDRHWIRSPFHTEVAVSLDDSPRADVTPGVTVEVLRTIRSPTATQVVADSLAADGFTVSDLTIESASHDWVTSSIDQTGTGRWTLTFAADEPPEPISLTIRGILWVSVPAATIVDLEEVPGG